MRFIYNSKSRRTTNEQIIGQPLKEYTSGVRRFKWCEIFIEKGLPALRIWVFFTATGGPQVSTERLQKHCNFWQFHALVLNTLSIERHLVEQMIFSLRICPKS